MQDRIKEIRKEAGLNQTEFGAKLGIAQTTVAGYENGSREVSKAMVLLICQKFSISEQWLLTGTGRMHWATTEKDELGDAVGQLMADRPESFKAAVVAALLRFDVDGPEWEVLERIYAEIAAEAEAQAKKKEE